MFEGTDLGDSWVLGWHRDETRRQLVFDLEVSLWPGNPAYDPPLPGDHTCYKRGQLIFDEVVDVNGLPSMHEVKPIFDPDGSIDYGTIEGFHSPEDGTYEFSIELLGVRVEGGGVRLEIDQLRETST